MPKGIGIQNISRKQDGKSKRISSYDVTGGNSDFYAIESGELKNICDIKGSGYINHIWVTMAPMTEAEDKYLPRKLVIRMYWDQEKSPSVEVPIGDFFGMGHGITKNFTSAPFTMSPEDGKAMNCFLPMPFSDGAKIEIENQSSNDIKFYFYIDYKELDRIDDDQLRFHAQWKRELPTDGIEDEGISNAYFEFGGKNTDGSGNYVILDAEGSGHYIGCNYNIHNLRMTRKWNWYGEGDDMIFIDGEEWPPSIHGTGTEDYFNTSWCPTQEQDTPYHGIILGGGPNWSGKSTYYRYHIQDAIVFNESIKVTIEHGHNNHRSDDISTTAYWYQSEPHKEFNELLSVNDRLPLDDLKPFNKDELKKIFG